MTVNFDHGAIPALTTAIKNDLDLNQQELGSLGSLVFFGNLAGSVCAAFVLSKMNYKLLLLISYIGNASGLFVFSYYKNYSVQCFSRFFSGFFQVS